MLKKAETVDARTKLLGADGASLRLAGWDWVNEAALNKVSSQPRRRAGAVASAPQITTVGF